MTDTLLDLSGTLPTEYIELLALVKETADRQQIPLLLIGATARNLILRYAHNIEIKRLTKDIDFGVTVNSWSRFQQLKKQLLATGKFKETKFPHRLIWQSEIEIETDFVPFGKLESPPGQITWQEDEFEMSTVGFAEAMESLIRVKLDEGLILNVVSLEGLALLKIISWGDRPTERERDAKDLWLVMNEYLKFNDEQLFGDTAEHADLLEDEDFDYTNAGARMLGRNISRIASETTCNIALSILAEDNRRSGIYVLTEVIKRAERSFDREDEVLTMWRELLQGISERVD